MFLMVLVLAIVIVRIVIVQIVIVVIAEPTMGFVKLKNISTNNEMAMICNCRLHHGDNGGGAEEGGGQAEGPHPLTGGAVAVRDLCLIILSYVSGRGADEGEKGYGKWQNYLVFVLCILSIFMLSKLFSLTIKSIVNWSPVTGLLLSPDGSTNQW